MTDDKIVKNIHDYQRRIKGAERLHKLLGIVVMFMPLPWLFLIVYMISISAITTYFGISVVFSIGILILFVVAGRHVERLQKKLKQFVGEYVGKDIIAEQIEIQEYKPNGCFDKDFLNSSGVLPGFSKRYGSDYIKGVYREKQITYCDIKLEAEERDSDGDYKTVTVFKGFVIMLALGKSLGDKRVRILEITKGGKVVNSIVNAYANFWRMLGVNLEEKTVRMESEAFNNRFEVKATDEELAFYILTPHFMESIMRADELAQGRTNICFNGDKAIIAIHNNYDAFEIGKNLKNENQLQESRERMRAHLKKSLLIVDEILKKDRLF